ncbi:phosphotransferase family protein [Lasallia pustulata]|uniref:Phosphotransferase family protein n=1 Tax=Lasallia pustulata TaxID=136370 RepID=A0A1W5CZD8_9LECA|nr:phosphotransferase family protein [Lasallia pustulata]
MYMELIRGKALMESWDALSRDDRVSICDQLRKVTTFLRRLEQDPEDICRYVATFVSANRD